MPFESGNKLGKGRPKGSTNDNQAIRESFRLLVEQNLGNMQDWLTATANQSPKAALQIIADLAQFSLPKLKQVDSNVDITGDSIINKITVELKTRDGNNDSSYSSLSTELPSE